MKPSYEVKAALKAAAKPILKELGKGWRLKIDEPLHLNIYRPSLIYKDTLTVYPVEGGFRANLKVLHNWESFGETAALAVADVLKSFQRDAPKLIRAIDAAHETCDDLLNSDREPGPFREALRAICGAEPPAFVRGHSSEGYTDDENEELQDWVGKRPCRPHWATNLSMIEAAELIVASAVENANIEGPQET